MPEKERKEWQKTVLARYHPADIDPGPAEVSILELLDETGESETYSRLRNVLEEQAIIQKDKSISNISSYALHAPLSLERISQDLSQWTSTLKQSSQTQNFLAEDTIKKINQETGRLLGIDLNLEESLHSFSIHKDNADSSLEEQCTNYILGVIMTTLEKINNAYSSITEDEMTLLLSDAPKLVEELIKSSNATKTIRSNISTDSDFIDIARKVKYDQLLQAMEALAMVTNPQFLDLLDKLNGNNAKASQFFNISPQFQGEFLLAQQTPIGLILIGGHGPNIYGADAAIIIDLGGDDLYTNNAGATTYDMEKDIIKTIRSPLGAIIDINGNDRYISNRFASLGSGFLGLGLLLDLKGNDSYSGDQLTEGSSLLGIGYLIDLDGNDTYISQELGQGAAIFGAGMLLDNNGNDFYSGAQFVQGFGGPQAIGQLIDIQGNDHYIIGGKKGSSYGTPQIYKGYGQGVGWGFRRLTAGGTGILHDLEGNDIYEAGNFAQGTGYYFGLGLLQDDRGDDKYWGSRYCQGSSAHAAIGILSDLAGNDMYSGEMAANQGAAWDVSVAGLFDYSGNDIYIGTELALGGGEQNGIGIFYEGDGQDIYIADIRKALGFGGDLSYGDGRNAKNLGIFIDKGNDTDFYLEKSREDDDFIVQGEVGIFVDGR